MSPKVSVIIPFFQRDKGILRKAVLSVLAQVNFNDYNIIIVDDDSPIPAYSELEDLVENHGNLIRIIQQKNAGPAAARNKGIDSLDIGTEYVAFLDSDDEWNNAHLENAVFALEKGYDLYFTNLVRYDREASFKRLVISKDHLLIDKDRQLFAYSGDLFDDLMHTNFITTSTVVYRYEKYYSLRFPEKLFIGEDYSFWLGLALMSARAVFSMNVECVYGKGINICDSADQWGAKGKLELISNDLKMYKFLLKSLALDMGQKRHVKKIVSGLRYNFAATLLHDIKQKRWFDAKILFRHIWIDPMTYAHFLPNCFKIFCVKYRR